MASLYTIDACEFVDAVQPLLARNDLHALLKLLKCRWTPAQIVSLLSSPNCDARKVAALSIGLVGGRCALEALGVALKDPDPIAHQMAEHAMWSIWFRLGSEEANHHLARGAMSSDKKRFDCAMKHFNRAIDLCPDFAEAYNQRAIVYYLQERYEDSLADCQRTVERMPCHFGAWAGMGHCYAHQGDIPAAINAYERAMAINPGLEGIRQAIGELRCETKP